MVPSCRRGDVSSIVDAAIARAVEHWADARLPPAVRAGGAPAAWMRRSRPIRVVSLVGQDNPVFGCNQLAIRAHWSARGVGSLIAQGTIIGRAPSSPEMAPKFRRGGVLSRAMRLLEDEAKSAMPVSTDCYSIKECAIHLISSE
jgi:hypothetical protein